MRGADITNYIFFPIWIKVLLMFDGKDAVLTKSLLCRRGRYTFAHVSKCVSYLEQLGLIVVSDAGRNKALSLTVFGKEQRELINDFSKGLSGAFARVNSGKKVEEDVEVVE